MKISDIKTLAPEGLTERRVMLMRELEHVVYYDNLTKTPEGKLFLEDLKLRLTTIKNLYSCIPPASPSATHLLAGFQGAQEELEELVDMLGNVNKFIQQYENEIKVIDQEVKSRIKAISNSKSESLLPSGYKKRSK